jgi:hypothetical protein
MATMFADFPDLIIHHRGRTGPQNNLLAVEAKLAENQHDKDFLTLSRLAATHRYQHAVFLQFHKDRGPEWHWITEAGRTHVCAQDGTCQLTKIVRENGADGAALVQGPAIRSMATPQ